MLSPKVVAGPDGNYGQPVVETVTFERWQRSIGSHEHILHRVFYLIGRYMLLDYSEHEVLVFFKQVFKCIDVTGNHLTDDFTIILIGRSIIHCSTRRTVVGNQAQRRNSLFDFSIVIICSRAGKPTCI